MQCGATGVRQPLQFRWQGDMLALRMHLQRGCACAVLDILVAALLMEAVAVTEFTVPCRTCHVVQAGYCAAGAVIPSRSEQLSRGKAN